METMQIDNWSLPSPEAGAIIQEIQPFTMLPMDRLASVYHAVHYIISNEIPGDVVECGVWKGGCAMLMAKALLSLKEKQKCLWLYDTFAGMTEPGEDDINLTTQKRAIEQYKASQKDEHNEWCYSPLHEVRTNMESTGFPAERVHFIQGEVESTIPLYCPRLISLLRLDTDWYKSTHHELMHMFPLLGKGGVLIVDDYWSWAGSKKAIDEYLTANGIDMLLFRIGASVVGIKS
jgi:O-methyltransferase